MNLLRRWVPRIIVGVVVVWALLWADALLGNRRLFNPYHFRILQLVGISAILAVSLNLVNGATGQFSIGHAGFMALGAYCAAALTVYGQHRFLPPLENAPALWKHAALVGSMLAGGTAAAVAGFVVGLPSLRLRGDYLAIVTLGFGEIIRVAILNVKEVGGAAGFNGYSGEFGRITIPHLTSFFWIALVTIAVILFSRNLLCSTHGLAFFSVREDEVAAEAMGVNTTRTKVTAFVMSAFFAGVAGALFAHNETYLQPETFGFLRSIEIVTMVVLGGMGSITGAVFGAVILTAAPEMLRDWLGQLGRQKVLPENLSPDVIRQLLFALLLVVLMLTRPQGVFGHRELSLSRIFRRRAGSPPAPAHTAS